MFHQAPAARPSFGHRRDSTAPLAQRFEGRPACGAADAAGCLPRLNRGGHGRGPSRPSCPLVRGRGRGFETQGFLRFCAPFSAANTSLQQCSAEHCGTPARGAAARFADPLLPRSVDRPPRGPNSLRPRWSQETPRFRPRAGRSRRRIAQRAASCRTANPADWSLRLIRTQRPATCLRPVSAGLPK